MDACIKEVRMTTRNKMSGKSRVCRSSAYVTTQCTRRWMHVTLSDKDSERMSCYRLSDDFRIVYIARCDQHSHKSDGSMNADIFVITNQMQGDRKC